jgi:TRAP-type C4-dicarboxylate transport system permease small subunit
MRSGNFLEVAERTVTRLSRGLVWSGMAALLAVLALIVLNVLLRGVWHSVIGVVQIAGLGLVITVALSLAYTTTSDGHITVDLFVRYLPRRVQIALDRIMAFLNLVVFVLFTWQSYLFGRLSQVRGDIFEPIEIAAYPFVYVLALGCGLASLAVLLKLLKVLLPGGKP